MKRATKQRAKLYAFFSKIFFEEMTEASLAQLQQSNGQIDFSDAELAAGYKKLEESVEQVASDESNLEELAADYASLFLGIGRRPAHPYESVYRSDEKIAMREPYHQVSMTFHAEGLRVSDAVKEPEDHVALEFEFMAHLCGKVETALENDDSAEAARLLALQKEFSKEHLVSWIPEWCDDIANGSTKLDFYAAIAALTKRFVVLDGEYLAAKAID
jgi:TorA maturation chaperone TorD